MPRVDWRYLSLGVALLSAALVSGCAYDSVVLNRTCDGVEIEDISSNLILLSPQRYFVIDGRRYPVQADEDHPRFDIYRYGPPWDESRIAITKAGEYEPFDFPVAFLQSESGQSDWIPCFDNDDAKIVGPQVV